MKKPIEGTFVLEGIIEGKIFSVDNTIDDWIKLASKTGLNFEVEINNNNFNLYPSPNVYYAENFSDEPEILIKHLLSELLKNLGETENIFSSLRSRQYLDQKERQTLFLVNENTLEVLIQQRDADVQTYKINKNRIKQAKFLKYLSYILIISISISWGYFLKFWPLGSNRIISNTGSNSISIEMNYYDPYIEITQKSFEISNQERNFILTIKKNDKFPTDDSLDNKTLISMTNILSRLAIEDLIRGKINLETRDKNNETLNRFSRPLNFNNTNTTTIRFPYNKYINNITIKP